MTAQFFKKIQKKYSSHEGFSLLEILLVVGVIATLSLAIIELTNGWANQEKNLSTARHLRLIHNAAESYIRDNFSGIKTALDTGTGVLEIPVNDTGGLTYYLKDGETYLPSTFSPINSYMQTITVLVRDASIGPAPEEGRIEALVVSSGQPIFLEDAIDIAQAAGSSGGLIAGIDAGTYGTATFGSVYGSWTTALANYAGLLWDDTNIPLDTDRAHLAAFIEINYQDIVSDYLYRVEIPGAEDANRMEVNLDMNNNNLTNTAVLSADRVNVTGNMTVGGAMSIDGGAVLENAVTVTGGLFVQDSIELGDVLAQGNVTTPEMNITGALQGSNGAKLSATDMLVSGGIGTTNMNTVAIEMNGGAIDVNGTGTVSAGEISNVGLINAGALGASTIRGSTVNATGGMEVNNAIQVDGNVVFNGPVEATGAMALGNLVNCPYVRDDRRCRTLPTEP